MCWAGWPGESIGTGGRSMGMACGGWKRLSNGNGLRASATGRPIGNAWAKPKGVAVRTASTARGCRSKTSTSMRWLEVIVEPAAPDGTGGVGGGPGMDAPPFREAVAGSLGCLGGDLSQDGPRLKRNALARFAADHGGRRGETARTPRFLGRIGPVGLSRTGGLGFGSLPAGESGIGGAPVLYRHRSRLLRAGGQDGRSLGQPRER